MVAADAAFPLLDRDPDEILFREPGQAITAAAFLRTALRVADALPDGGHVVNLCQDRFAFAVVFAAAVLRRQISLLTSDRSPGRLRILGEQYSHTYSVSNDPAAHGLDRHAVVDCASGDGAHAPAWRDMLVPRVAADQPVAEVFTSGTTGESESHRKCWGALVSRSRDAARQFEWRHHLPCAIVATVPPQHMYGFETSVLLPLHAPASSWCGPAFYPHDIQRALAESAAPRCLVTTPLQIQTLLRAGVTLPDLATVISATAPLDPAVAAEAERRWQTQVLEVYGATEVGSIASRRTTKGELWTLYPGVRFTPDAPTLTVEAPYAAAHPLADLVEDVDDRRFRLLGRRADLLKLGGRRASLAGLNVILNRIEGVADGVFVVPDDLDRRPTARLRAFAVSTGPSSEEILAALRQAMDPVFLPRRVILVPRLPRNDVGKLTRVALDGLLAAFGEA